MPADDNNTLTINPLQAVNASERDVLKAVFDSTNAMLAYLDLDFNFVAVNNAYAEGCRRSVSELIGKNHFALFPSEENEELFRTVRDTGRPVALQDKPFVYPQQPERGTTYWNWRLVPVKSSAGFVAGFVLSLSETTTQRRAELTLRRALEAGEVMTFEWDIASDAVRRSDNSRAILGCEPVDTGDAFWERVHPEDRAMFRALVDSMTPEHPAVQGTYRFLRPTGGTAVVEDMARATFDASGRMVSVSGLLRDVTERSQVEDELRRQEQHLRLVTDATPALISYIDHDLRYRFVNRQYELWFGLPRAEVVGRTMEEVLGANAFAQLRPSVEKALAGADVRFAAEVPYERGGARSIDAHYVPDLDDHGAVRGFFVLVLDVTEQRRAAAELARTRERLEAALAAGDVATWVWDVAAAQLSADANLGTLFDRKGGRPVGGYFDYIEAVHVDDRSRVRDLLVNALAEGKPFEAEFRIPLADGRTRWLLARGRVEKDLHGVVTRMPGVVFDVTARKEAELGLENARAELRGYAANLEATVQARTARLQELVAELEHFSYSITHDMRAPLRAMRGFAEVMDEMASEISQPEFKKFLGHIITAAERMDLLITDALNYSKVVRQNLPLAPVDVHQLLAGMLETYPEFVSQRSCIRVEGTLLPVLGNEAGLTQCLSNLLGNALKFVEPGKTPEVRVWSEYVRKRPANEEATRVGGLNLVANAPAGEEVWVRLFVADKGIGISATMIPRVFDMFSRGAGHYGGTGIGLALVRKVVQRMGGTVGVESEQGCGSCFHMDLKPGAPPGP